MVLYLGLWYNYQGKHQIHGTKKQEKPALNLMISNCTRLREYFLTIHYVIAMFQEASFRIDRKLSDNTTLEIV